MANLLTLYSVFMENSGLGKHGSELVQKCSQERFVVIKLVHVVLVENTNIAVGHIDRGDALLFASCYRSCSMQTLACLTTVEKAWRYPRERRDVAGMKFHQTMLIAIELRGHRGGTAEGYPSDREAARFAPTNAAEVVKAAVEQTLAYYAFLEDRVCLTRFGSVGVAAWCHARLQRR
jgi:hypothetical protein